MTSLADAEQSAGRVAGNKEDILLQRYMRDLPRFERYINNLRVADQDLEFNMQKTRVNLLADVTRKKVLKHLNPGLKELWRTAEILYMYGTKRIDKKTYLAALNTTAFSALKLGSLMDEVARKLDHLRKLALDMAESSLRRAHKFMDPDTDTPMDDGRRDPERPAATSQILGFTSAGSTQSRGSSSCRCQSGCGAHQGADFTWCVVGKDCADGINRDPSLEDHRLYESQKGQMRPVAGRFWDYCVSVASQGYNTAAPLTSHLGCQCQLSDATLKMYDPIARPYFRADMPSGEDNSGDVKVDLKKIPFRDRYSFQIAASILKPDFLQGNDILQHGQICTRPRMSASGDFGWAVCPTDPRCSQMETSHMSPWHADHSWDYCTEAGWTGGPGDLPSLSL